MVSETASTVWCDRMYFICGADSSSLCQLMFKVIKLVGSTAVTVSVGVFERFALNGT